MTGTPTTIVTDRLATFEIKGFIAGFPHIKPGVEDCLEAIFGGNMEHCERQDVSVYFRCVSVDIAYFR